MDYRNSKHTESYARLFLQKTVSHYKEIKGCCFFSSSTFISSFKDLIKNPYPHLMAPGYLINIQCFNNKGGSPKAIHALLTALKGREPTEIEQLDAKYRLAQLSKMQKQCRLALLVTLLLLPYPPITTENQCQTAFQRLLPHARQIYKNTFVKYFLNPEENFDRFLRLAEHDQLASFYNYYYQKLCHYAHDERAMPLYSNALKVILENMPAIPQNTAF